MWTIPATSGPASKPPASTASGPPCSTGRAGLFPRVAGLGGGRAPPRVFWGVIGDNPRASRPAQKAPRQHGVRAPLLDAGMTKAEIRELSRQAGLPTWDRRPGEI